MNFICEAHIVEVVEAGGWSVSVRLEQIQQESTHALLPPAVLFAAAMAKLCPDYGNTNKRLHERAWLGLVMGVSWAPRPGILCMLYSVHTESGLGDAKRLLSTTVANQTIGLRHAEGI
jgi:glucose uptake protein GlcU